MKMSLANHFEDADAFYERLVAIHEALDDEQSERFNLSLILMLANHIGDAATLADLMDQAKQAVCSQ